MEMIKVENLTKNYKTIQALKGVSLTINEGELYGLLGVNGAGKTTLIKILSGLTKATDGNAWIKGYDLFHMDEIKKIIDVSPQETAVALNLTVEENLRFFQSIYDMKDEEYLRHIIESFSLDEVIHKTKPVLFSKY